MEITENAYKKSVEIVDKLLSGRSLKDLSEEEKKDLDFHSDIIEAYEQEHFPIELPSLNDVIKLRMSELNLKEHDLATLLEVPTARVLEYLNGRREITLDVARKLHKKLDIEADIILQ